MAETDTRTRLTFEEALEIGMREDAGVLSDLSET